MTNKIKKFLYILEHLIPDGRDEIPTFALYHPLLIMYKLHNILNGHISSTFHFHQHFSFILPHLAAAWGWLCKPSSGYHGISMSKLENTMKVTLHKDQYFFQVLIGFLGIIGNTCLICWFSKKTKNFHHLMLVLSCYDILFILANVIIFGLPQIFER